MLSSEDTHVLKLTLTGPRRDTPALRLSAANRLSALDLTPPGLAPSAILLIDRITTPLPGRRASREVRRTFERALQSSMLEKFRQARRPIDGCIEGSPEAVLFADPSEMAACRIVAVAAGRATQWWWARLFASRPTVADASAGIRDTALADPETIPAIFSRLVMWEKALSVAAALRPEDAAMIGAAMLEHIGMGHLARVVFDDPIVPPPRMGPETAFGSSLAPKKRRDHAPRGPDRRMAESNSPDAKSTLHMKPPWRALESHRNQLLDTDRRILALFGLADTLRRRPHVVRSTAYQHDLTRWLQAERRASMGENVPPRPRHPFERGPASTAGAESRFLARTGVAVPSRAQRPAEAASLTEEAHGSASSIRETASSEDDIAETASDSAEGFHTRIGGLLYLINLMDALDIPRSLTESPALTDDMSRWALLDVLARGLLGHAFAVVRTDPLWSLLAELDERAPDRPIADVSTMTAGYRLPSDWMAVLRPGGGSFAWATTSDRLLLWSDDGYLTAELPRGPGDDERRIIEEMLPDNPTASPQRLRRENADTAPLEPIESLMSCGIPEHLSRLLSRLLPALRRVLRILLGGAAAGADDMPDRLFSFGGSVSTTPTHIDWVTDMDNISIDIRKAGLDRDPGWLPEWGRVVKFHFR